MFSVWQNGPTRLKSDFLVHRFQTFTFGIGYTLKIGRVPPPERVGKKGGKNSTTILLTKEV